MKYRFPYIRPVLPPPPRWTPYLQSSYEANWFSNFGPVVRAFEAALSRTFCHQDEAITTASSCTAGLTAALIALGVRGTVAFPAFTFPATHSAIMMAGATPGVLDVDPDTWSLSPRSLERTVHEQRCEAVVLVAPFGVARDFTEHFEICRRFGIPIVIDNAAGLGGPLRALPHDGCFEVYSLHATKVFAIGEGGAIRSKDTQIANLHRAINFGLEGGAPAAGCWGINGKLPEFSAAVGLAMLEDLDAAVRARREMAARYLRVISSYNNLVSLTTIEQAPWQTFPVLFPGSAELLRFIKETAARGVEVRRYYRPSLDAWPHTLKLEECPAARSLAERMVCLPLYSDLHPEEASELIQVVKDSLDLALP